jgi:hypothetical protein
MGGDKGISLEEIKNESVDLVLSPYPWPLSFNSLSLIALALSVWLISEKNCFLESIGFTFYFLSDLSKISTPAIHAC